MKYYPLLLKQNVASGRFCNRSVLPKKMWFKEIIPMCLKNSVSGKTDKLAGALCLQELSLLLACLKKAEFEDSMCQPEFKIYNQCIEKEEAARLKLRGAMKQGVLGVDDSARLSFRQVNRLLGMYQQPGSTVGKMPQKLPTIAYSDPMWDKVKKNVKKTRFN